MLGKIDKKPMRTFFKSICRWNRRKVYKPGRVLSGFVARDVRRDIKIVSIDKLDDGLILAQVRTNNVLYLSKRLMQQQDFSEPTMIDIATMWKWSGKPWGGLPDGTSIADHVPK